MGLTGYALGNDAAAASNAGSGRSAPAVPGSIESAAQLFALSAFALGQPLLDLLGRYPPLLVAHEIAPAELVALTVALLIGLPGALWGVEAALSRIHRRSVAWVHRALVFGLLTATVLPLLRPLGHGAVLGGSAEWVVAGGVALAATIALARSTVLRRVVALLGLAPIVFAASFFANSDIAKLLQPDAGGIEASAPPENPLPVVLVVFDELPLVSLLDERSQIDAVRYPAFARLAAQSTWFRDATAVHVDTNHALPAILTGRYPEPGLLGTRSDHPRNLFSLLEDHYEVVADEPITSLHAAAPRDAASRAQRIAALASDLRILALHILLPADAADALPPVTELWRDFAAEPAAGDDAELHANRPERFREFVASMQPMDAASDTAGSPPPLYFLHSLLPHAPWQYLPSGRAYHPSNIGIDMSNWGAEPWWITQGQQQHLLQLGFTDALLGELVSRLEAVGLFERSLLIVTADHGAGFWPNRSRRDIHEHPSDAVGIPLFVKLPGQSERRLVRGNVEIVDILPTVAQVIGARVPWPVDGCSMLDSACPPRTRKHLADLYGSRVIEADRLGLGESLYNKLGRFGSGASTGEAGLFAPDLRPDLRGRRVDEFETGPPTKRVLLMRDGFDHRRRDPDAHSTARISGRIGPERGESMPDAVAVAIRGVIRAVVPVIAHAGPGRLFSGFVAEDLEPAEESDVEIYSLDVDSDRPVLRRLRWVQHDSARFEPIAPDDF